MNYFSVELFDIVHNNKFEGVYIGEIRNLRLPY